MSGGIMSHKLQTVAKDNEEKKANERKRNLLYLIGSYLKENGFNATSDCFTNEAQLSNSMEVCDNVDLDIIMQEYLNYYYTKFKKYPKIIKKQEEPKIPSKVSTPKAKKIQSAVQSPGSIKQNTPESPFTITPCPLPALQSSLPDSTMCEGFRPLYDYSGFNSEWKELADIVSKEIIGKDLNVKWSDIKGLDSAKTLLKEAVLYPLVYPQLFTRLPIPWKGILLYGPPGTGKTLLAKALASQCQGNTFFNMSASSLISKWRGESEKLVRVLFELAKFQAPATVFIDEVDALSSKRDECQHEASRRFKSELLVQMDGINNNQTDRVFLLATTNIPWEIDQAILRRFEKRILVGFPKKQARSKMFKHYLIEFTSVQHLTEQDYEMFAEETSCYTGSDIKMICKEAAISLIREHIQGQLPNSPRPIRVDDVINAIKTTKPPARNLEAKYFNWQEQFGCE